MLKLSIFSLLFLLTNQESFAAKYKGYQKALECKMPQNEHLVIGCTNYCGRFNRWALKRYGKKLGYKVKTVNLNANNKNYTYKDVDGVIIPGGSDINPNYYVNKVTPEMKSHIEKHRDLAELSEIGKIRDEYEFKLLKDYFADANARYQPVLGICRGMQVISVSQGLPLYLDIKTELGIKNRKYTLDRVTVSNEESLLKEVIGKNSFRAVELHHQGINMSYYNKHRDSYPQLEVTSLSNGGKIAESVELYDRPVLGVQFHPEYTFGRVRRGTFSWLLKQACFNHNNSKLVKEGK